MQASYLFIFAVTIGSLTACSNKENDADSVKAEVQENHVVTEKEKNAEILNAIEAGRQSLLEKVSACGWKSAPESAGFFLGMSLPQAKVFASSSGYTLTCKESAPITGESVTELVEKMLSDEFTVSREWRASNLCETTVDGNQISLFFFRAEDGGVPILAKAYNSLDKYKKHVPADTYMAAVPVMEALSEKYGFDIDKNNQCYVNSGNGYESNFSVTFARPFPDRMPNQPNIGLFFTVTDKSLIEIGGAITKARDDAAQAQKAQSEKSALRESASKL